MKIEKRDKMEEMDLTKVQLADVGFNSKWSFYNKFLQYGITTVAQVLDDDFINEVMEHTKKQTIRDEMRGFIDMIKYEFLDKPLTTDIYLEEPAKSMENIIKGDCSINFSRMGFIEGYPYEFRSLYFLYKKFKAAHLDMDEKEYKVADVFHFAVGNRIPTSDFERKIKICLDSYNRSKDHNISLDILKQDLSALQEERNQLEEKIKKLEEKIANLSKGKNI